MPMSSESEGVMFDVRLSLNETPESSDSRRSGVEGVLNFDTSVLFID